ncbi:ABC transporter permease [Paenibacillus sp. GXUN7292]|uniref:ABC transporter permease n=1 Tax=Paenibacillus sp. GXUN7292 TaxID=3422499 RepID=UPI003D7DBCC3
MIVWHIAWREIRLGFRNPWAYSFLALFSFFSLALLLVQSQNTLQGYTHTTGSMINLVLYLLPLMTMLLGSFSLTSEKEDGGWELLSTYPLSAFQLLLGKYIGLVIVLSTIVCFGYGLSGVFGWLLGNSFTGASLVFFMLLSLLLVLLFLGIALLAGTIAANRWQALTIGVGIWFVFIIGWSTLLIAVLGWLPYLWIKPAIVFLTFFNPAELIRIFMVVKIGGGSILGPEYAQWIDWIRGSWGSPIFIGVCMLWITISLLLAIALWERRRKID